MIGYIANFLLSFIGYLFLTANQGDILGFWSQYEIIFGVIISVIVTIISTNVLFRQKEYNWLNPVRWVIFLAYIVGPFFYAMAKANIDVAIRDLSSSEKN